MEQAAEGAWESFPAVLDRTPAELFHQCLFQAVDGQLQVRDESCGFARRGDLVTLDRSDLPRDPEAEPESGSEPGRWSRAAADRFEVPSDPLPLRPPSYRSILSAAGEFGSDDRQVTIVADYLRAIRLYRTWTMGREAPARRAQDASGQADYLEPDGANLALLLRDFELHSGLANRITTELRRLSPTVDRYSVVGIHGQLMLYLQEEGLSKAVSALRLSDGMLRYLCLLAILLHPTPPPLVVLEEPELGLHPDLHGRIGELLVEASERMQLIVTTHSPGVLAALRPEHVMVCERADDGTQVKRLTAEALREWLDQYTLGDLWQMGVIGGNRY